LRAIQDEMKAPGATGNVRQLRQLSGEFQLAVFRAARNHTIYRLLEHLQEKIRQFGGSTLTRPGRAKEVIAYAKALVAAIEKRNGDAAEKIARANRRRTLELRIKMLRASGRGG
jgi:DNA-binding GntR family transcriptional regulator